MPPPRSQPARASQRRNSLQDETPGRTRGRAAKPAPSKSEQPEFHPPNKSPTKLSPTATRKTTRSASNISGRSAEAASDVYASYERPLLMVFGLSPDFFDGLRKHHGKLPKQRKSLVSSFPPPSSTSEGGDNDDDDSEPIARLHMLRETDSEEESAEESEVDQVPVESAAPRGRGRGGRGSRGGGRGRGTRGRGRGGRGRGGVARGAASARGKSSRNATAMVPLTEEDDEETANQGSAGSSAMPTPQPQQPNEDDLMSDSDMENENGVEDDDDLQGNGRSMQGVQQTSTTSTSSPPPGVDDSALNGAYAYASQPAPDAGPQPSVKATKVPPIPRIKLPTKSASHTPRAPASTPAATAVLKLLAPEDDILSESDLPEPWDENPPHVLEADCEDKADYLLQTRFKPMVDVQNVINTLTKYAPSQRSTESLFALATNTQRILQEFQDEYLKLDARVSELPVYIPLSSPSYRPRHS
jgi:hypothetical protein